MTHCGSRSFAVLLTVIGSLDACGTDSGVTPPPEVQLTFATGNNQTFKSFETVPVDAMLIASDGKPVQRVNVEFTVTSGGGSLQPPSARTDIDGHAIVGWRLGRSGSQSLEVAVPAFDLHATFSATADLPTVVVLHYDGTNWTTSLQVANGAYPTAYAIWGSSASDVFVAGSNCNKPSIVHFDGTSWGDMEACQGPPSYGDYYSDIWGSSATDVWRLSGGPHPSSAIEHYDGHAWSYAHILATPPTAVWTKSPNTVFAIDGSGVIRYDGTSWTRQTGPGGGWRGMWGHQGSDTVLIVGNQGGVTRYDGATWAVQSSGTTADLNAVWGSSPSDVFAVGANGTVLHYDGAVWMAEASGTTKTLNGVWGSSGSSVFAVGDGIILRFDGTSWTPQQLTTPMMFYDVWGTSPTNVYAVGTGPAR